MTGCPFRADSGSATKALVSRWSNKHYPVPLTETSMWACASLPASCLAVCILEILAERLNAHFLDCCDAHWCRTAASGPASSRGRRHGEKRFQQMVSRNFQQLSNFIWSVVDLLRGPYRPRSTNG